MKDFLYILALLKKLRRLTIAVAIISVTLSLLNLVTPIIFKELIDFLVALIEGKRSSSEAVPFLTALIVIYTVVMVGNTTLQLILDYTSSIWGIKLGSILQRKSLSHLHSLSMVFFEKESSGQIKEKIDDGIRSFEAVLSAYLYEILPPITRITGAAIIMLNINKTLTFLTFACFPLFIYVSVRSTRILNQKQVEFRGLKEEVSGVAYQNLTAIKTVKSYSMEENEQDFFGSKIDDSIKVYKERTFLRQKINFIRHSILNITRSIVIGYASYLALNRQITIGDIVLFITYVEMVYNPIWRMTRVYDRIQQGMVSVKRFKEILITEPEVKDKINAKKINKVKGEVEFKNLSFGYGGETTLKNLNLNVKQGEIVALVGESGVGKSTLAKLILRLYDATEGAILVDGNDVRDITQKSLRKNIGVVLQDTVLFNNSIFENIRYGTPKATKEQVIKAAKIANAHNFIMKLPKAYNTVVGERGVKLSGGEQQRINIARAVLKNAPILILDEATSHLDSKSEKLVQDALWKLIQGKTTIIIAHRLSTVMRADKILVLDKGRIAEEGTHKELIDKDGLYAKLFNIQSGAMLLKD